MMKVFIHPFLSFATLFAFLSFLPEAEAQSPPGLINYQAVARDVTTGAELTDREVFLRALVRRGGPSGTIVYQESHADVETDLFGLFNVQIGAGEVLTGSLLGIDWAADSYWLEIELDAGEGPESAGVMQLVAVPYAFHAETATNVDDADADPDNERITEVSYNAAENSVTITEGGFEYTTGLGPVDLDIDPTNELITAVSYNAAANAITITEAGTTFSTGLGPIDLDTDPTNELIDTVQLLDNNILQITEAGIDHEVDLSPLTESALWQLNPESEAVINTENQIGMGTETPGARLGIRGDAGEQLLRLSSQETSVLTVTGSEIRSEEGSIFSVEGQMRYGVTLLNNSENQVYTVTESDTHIIVQITPGNTQNVTIQMPDAVVHPGRVITVRRTGESPISTLTLVTLEFNDPVDFGAAEEVLLGPVPDTRIYISMGETGWTRIQ